jgi:hypothetical protein
LNGINGLKAGDASEQALDDDVEVEHEREVSIIIFFSWVTPPSSLVMYFGPVALVNIFLNGRLSPSPMIQTPVCGTNVGIRVTTPLRSLLPRFYPVNERFGERNTEKIILSGSKQKSGTRDSNPRLRPWQGN